MTSPNPVGLVTPKPVSKTNRKRLSGTAISIDHEWARWVQDEMHKRGWTQQRLSLECSEAAEMTITQAAVSKAINLKYPSSRAAPWINKVLGRIANSDDELTQVALQLKGVSEDDYEFLVWCAKKLRDSQRDRTEVLTKLKQRFKS